MISGRRKAQREEVIKSNRTHASDVGSDRVQSALLEEKISELKRHLKTNPKDNDAINSIKRFVYKYKKISGRLESNS